MTKKPDKTPFQKFQALAKALVKVPKAEVAKKLQERRAQNRAKQ